MMVNSQMTRLKIWGPAKVQPAVHTYIHNSCILTEMMVWYVCIYYCMYTAEVATLESLRTKKVQSVSQSDRHEWDKSVREDTSILLDFSKKIKKTKNTTRKKYFTKGRRTKNIQFVFCFVAFIFYFLFFFSKNPNASWFNNDAMSFVCMYVLSSISESTRKKSFSFRLP